MVVFTSCKRGKKQRYTPWWLAFKASASKRLGESVLAGLGQSCSPSSKCTDQMKCLAGRQVCTDNKVGSPCVVGWDCQSDACISGKCVDKGRNGDKCSPSRPCETGLNCLAGVQKCTDKKIGSSCAVRWDCHSDACISSKCVDKGRNGDSCSPARPCETGLNCLAGVQKCTDKKVGSSCVARWDCQSDACISSKGVDKGRTGDSCGPAKPCGSGLKCLAGKQKCTDGRRHSPCTAFWDCKNKKCKNGKCR